MSHQRSQQPNKIWMVMGSGPTSVIHKTRESAEQEADRLAQQHHGQWFFVMESVAAYRSVTTTRHAFDHMDRNGQVPF